MGFPKYPELPKEIRLMIIEEAIQSISQESVGVRYHDIATAFISPLSSIDYEWNRAIEMRLFKAIRITPRDLSDFAEICSKRHGRLNTIKLSISHEDRLTDSQPEYMVGSSIARLLHIMKDWSPLDRERQGLIEVQLDVSMVCTQPSLGFDISPGLGALPEVPVIGSLYEVADWAAEPGLHPSSSLCLYQGLPNVRHVSLNLRLLDDENASLEQASSKHSCNLAQDSPHKHEGGDSQG